ncbi:MAG: hypothetical protein IJW44_04110 [Clostridia bacterium]|nr:hypothetical protein [Clostridia bacterium]
MKSMKGILAGILALVLALCVGLVGCAEKQQEEKESAFAVVSDGVSVELGADAKEVLNALGESQAQQEVFDCGAGNSRMYYRYGSLDLYTMKTGEGETVDQIDLKDDLATTSRGICIGDTLAKVKEAYGNPSAEEEGQLTYSKDGKHLVFRVSDGTVTGISLIRKTA